MSTELYTPRMCESLVAFKGRMRKEGRTSQQATDSLPKQSGARQTRTDELEACTSNAILKLKSPLSRIIMTSNAIFNITDLTPEELCEYLQQIRSNAYHMDEMIDNLLIHSQ